MAAGRLKKKTRTQRTMKLVVFTIFPSLVSPGLSSTQPGIQTWALVWTHSSRRLPLDLAPEQKRELLKLREDAEVSLPLFLFSPFPCTAISWQLQFNKSENVRDRSLPLQVAELQSPESGGNPVACLFPFSNPPLFDPPCGPQSGTIKATELWSEDQRGDPWGPEIIGKLQRGTSSEKWTYKVICELLGSPLSCACWVWS